MIRDKLSNIEEEIRQLTSRIDGQYKAQEKKISGLLEREDWTRKRFEDEDEKIEGILKREDWVRKRFEEEDKKIEGILERENWTRKRFEEQNEKIEGILGREDWIRKRFEEQQKLIKKNRNKIKGLLEESAIDSEVIEIQDRFYNKKTYSQSGEDAIVSYVLNFMGYDLSNITYLDLGANHAMEMSNTYAYYCNGCSGVLLEANPELIPELQKERPRDIILNRALTFNGSEEEIDFYVLSGDGLSTISYEEAQHVCKVNPELFIKKTYRVKAITITEILERYFKKSPEILSIDLEGIEEKILLEINLQKVRPLIIILENVSYSPSLVIDRRENKLKDILSEKGYVEYAFTGINSIYLDSKEVEKFNNEIMEKVHKREKANEFK